MSFPVRESVNLVVKLGVGVLDLSLVTVGTLSKLQVFTENEDIDCDLGKVLALGEIRDMTDLSPVVFESGLCLKLDRMVVSRRFVHAGRSRSDSLLVELCRRFRPVVGFDPAISQVRAISQVSI